MTDRVGPRVEWHESVEIRQRDGHEFKVTPTNAIGIHSGRRRHRVECVTCQAVVHEATTGPSQMIERHLREARTGSGSPLDSLMATPVALPNRDVFHTAAVQAVGALTGVLTNSPPPKEVLPVAHSKEMSTSVAHSVAHSKEMSASVAHSKEMSASLLASLADDPNAPRVGYLASDADRATLARIYDYAPPTHVGDLMRRLVRRILFASCAVGSRECSIRQECVNKCGELDDHSVITKEVVSTGSAPFDAVACPVTPSIEGERVGYPPAREITAEELTEVDIRSEQGRAEARRDYRMVRLCRQVLAGDEPPDRLSTARECIAAAIVARAKEWSAL